jgi:hypothetical protein
MTIDPMAAAAAIVVVIGAFSASMVTVVNAVGNVKKELITVQRQNGQIHELVNGSSVKAAEKLTALEQQIASLHKQLEQLQALRVEDAKVRERP